MNINLPSIKYAIGTTMLTGTLLLSSPVKICAQNQPAQDTFVKSNDVTPDGTTDKKILTLAPSPDVCIQGKNKKAVFVVDLANNILYQYDKAGNALKAYSVATGKESTPTHRGTRIVSHVETYPYNTAGRYTKRRRSPASFGPKIIILNVIDPVTGERYDNGEYIHGNNNPSSIGQKASHGCIRMDNEVIKELADYVSEGDIVLIK